MTDFWYPKTPFPRGLVRPVKVDPDGITGPTRGQARGSRWRSLGRGWFVSADAPSIPEQRILDAAAFLPPVGAVTGWAACRMHGAAFMDGLMVDGFTPLPVPLVIGRERGTRGGPGVVFHRDRLDPAEIVTCHGVPCVNPERAVFDAMRWAVSLREAVVAFDAVAAAGVTSTTRLRLYLESRVGWAGVSKVRDALTLTSELTRSPAETRMRLLWTLDAGLPRPLVNCRVGDGHGRFVAEVDLLDPEIGLVGEYDGAHHRSGERHTRDVFREDALRRLGLEVVTVTGRDLARPNLVVERIHAARSRAALIPPEAKTFMIKVAGNR